MAVYFVAAYDVSDPEKFAEYSPGSVPVIMKTIARHGGEVLSVGPHAHFLEGQRQMCAVLRFPSAEAVHAWHDDPDYAQAKRVRQDSTTNVVAFIAPEFVMPR